MLEQIVRPFQQSGAIASRGVVSTRARLQREKARLVWGSAGNMPTADKEEDGTDPSGYNFKLEACDDTYKEKSRDTEKIRVENPDDNSQYVMVDRIKLISFAHQSDSKILSSFSTETTAFADSTISDSPAYGTVGKNDKCKATYSLATP